MFKTKNPETRSSFSKSFSKAGMLLTGSGPPAYKQLKQAIIDGNEDKAIAIYTSREGGRSPMTDIHPSKPFPSKKQLSEETPLHLAAKFSLIKLFEMFLEYGGNPGIGNARNENCIHSVCLLSSYPAKRAELVELIIEWRGVRSDNTIEKVMLDHVDVDGNTAMHLAAYNGLLQCIECLIEAGATLSVQNSEGATCCEIADKGGNPGVGTMLELAWVYKPIDQSIIASDNYHKFSNDLQTARIILDCRSLTLDGLSKFIEHAITFISESLGEKRSRAEVLLSHFSWDASKLKKEYLSNSDRVLTSARLHAKPELDKPEESDVQKTGQINVGISIDDVFLDNCYKPNTPYVVYKDGKRYTYAIKYFNGRTGVFPIDFDPTKSQVSDYSDTSHITPKKTDPCPICTEIMHESCNVQHFVSGNLVEPKHRELKCLSGHKYCFSCWSDHLQAQVMRENGVGCLPCPGYNCGEILDLEWAPVMLKSPDLVNRLLAQRQRQVIDSTNLKWCPVANCGLLVHITSTARPGETTVSSPQSVVCANGHGFCLSCSREAHSPCSCADLIIWQEEVREETKNTDLKSPDNIANVLVSTPSSKKCASCSTMVNKEDGCNHMICPDCRTEFCWICMQDWSLHSDNKGSYFQCNRFIERYRENGMPEEKGSDSHGNRTFGKGKRHKTIHFIHHYVRFQAHGESMKLESKRSKETKERIVSGLKSCKEGSLKWLQGEKVANPYKGKESDEMFSHLRDLNIRDIKDTVISEYYLPIEESVAFLNDAFEELEKCRNFLRWSYPFALFEFDENFQTVGNKPVMSRKSKQSKDRLDEARLAFDLLQAALEAKTEALSDLIARKRLRGTRNEISLATRDAKSKRLELEILVISYYNIEERDDEVPLSSNSSLTASWDSERDEIKADDPKSRDSKSSRDRQDVMQDFDDNPLRVDDVYSRSYHEYPEDNMRKRNSGASRSSRNSSRRSDDEFHHSRTMSRSGSFVGKAVTNNSSFYGDTASRQKSRSYHEEEEEMVIKPQKLHGRSMESASVTKFDRNMQNSMSKYNYEYPHDRAEISVSSNGDSGQMNRSIFRAGSAGGAGSNHITETILEIESLIQQGYSREKAIRIYFDRNPDRSYDPNASYNIEENQYYPEDDFSEEQSIIEQRLIGAKKNPDQEALEHGLLLSQQEAEFGVNMYESLTPDDELVIDEYVAQDFTREEAILFIFEHKYGKVSTQPKNITPALPTLHKVPPGHASHPISRVGSSDNMGSQLSEIEEEEIERLMARGYTREQALEVYSEAMGRQLRNTSVEENSSSSNRHVVQRVGVGAHSSNLVSGRTINNVAANSALLAPPLGAAPEYMGSDNGGDEDVEIELLMSRGYTREQATEVYFNRRNRTSQLNATLSQPSSDAMNRRGVASPPGRSLSRAVSVSSMPSAATSVVGMNSYEYDEGLDVNESEIEILMSRGYTREQAEAVYEDRLASQRNYGNSGNASVHSSVVRASADDYEMEAGVDQIELLMSRGYTREQAHDFIEREIRERRSSQENMYVMQQRPVQPNPTPSIYRSHSNSISEYAGPRSVSGPQHAPVGPVTMGMPNGYQTNGTNRWFRTRKTPDQEALEIGLLLSEQEAEFGINMYDSLTPADDPEIEYLTSQGYSTDEAILIIFERRYYRSNAPYRNEFGMQMEMNARGSGGDSVVGRNSYESPQQQYADYYSEPISRLSPYSSHQNMYMEEYSPDSRTPQDPYLFAMQEQQYHQIQTQRPQSQYRAPMEHSPSIVEPTGKDKKPARKRSFSRSSSFMNNTNNNRGSTRSTNSATGSHAEDEVLSRAIRLSLEQQNAAQYSSNHSAYTTSNRSYDRQDYGGGSNYRSSPGQMQCREADVRTLIGLGFTPNQAMNALMQNNNNVEMAANSLFGLG